jgi:CRISPR/Cas system-associated exonuclease Cas4 (RecB family)
VEVRPRRPGIHPSGISTDCLRKLWYSAVGAEESRAVDAELQVTFDIGHSVHGILQSYGERGAWGPEYVPEVDVSGPPLADTLMIEGHADADTVMTVDAGPDRPLYEVGVVHEYKTIKTEQYAKLTGPKPEHKQQATVYAAALDRPLVAYLYVNKNDSSMRDFVVQFDKSLWESVAAKCRAVVEHVRNGTEPRGSPGFGCSQCPYAHACPDRRK